jgi:hypothetical protein
MLHLKVKNPVRRKKPMSEKIKSVQPLELSQELSQSI